MWELDYLRESGALRSEVAQQVEEFLTTTDVNRAVDLMFLLEAAVAPVNGGLSEDAPAVVTAVVAGLPLMSLETRAEALLLLTQIGGSVQAIAGSAGVAAGRRIEEALPLVAAVIESGADADIAQGIDLISMASTLSSSAAERAEFYLARIASTTTGAIRASAVRELDEVRRRGLPRRADS